MSPILVIAVLMIALWLLSLALRDASVIDPGWGLGFVLVAWAEWLRDDSNLPVALLPLVTIWGLRLAGYLFYRKLKEPSEDRRYKSMREKHGGNFWWISLFTVFLLQGVIMYVVSLPLLNGLVEDPRSLNLLLAGTALWFVGLVFETVGDWQLLRFKAKSQNKGQVLDTGLWRYTRHPNYFGDFCVWWGMWLAAFASGAPWWTIISPLVMSVLLMKVSGVTLLESDIDERRPEYAQYKQRTSAFFPWWPKRAAS